MANMFLRIILVCFLIYSSFAKQSKMRANRPTNNSANNSTNNLANNSNNKTAPNMSNSTNTTISRDIKAYCFVDLDGVAFDISNLHDPDQDYVFNNGKNFFYLNLCSFGSAKCRKDKSYLTYINQTDVNSTDCDLLSGSNKDIPPVWKIIRMFLLTFR